MSTFIKNFYSSTQQYDAISLRAFDEGPIIRDRSIGVNSSSISTAETDYFRQGVEITLEKHTLGTFKISAGTPGHIIKPTSYGTNDKELISTGSFFEIDYFDPILYLKVQEPGTTITNVITFPIITSDNDQSENYLLNGIIEPLSIRPVISFFSIEYPFESHATRGALMAGNTSKFSFSSDLILTVSDNPDKLIPEKLLVSSSIPGGRGYINEASFIDVAENLLSSVLSGSGEIPSLGVGYINPDLNSLSSFDDTKVYLKTMGITEQSHGIDMVAVLLNNSSSIENYIPPGKKSATAGFVYDNVGYSGTDSIAFGGMVY